jgi:hypothetical protein
MTLFSLFSQFFGKKKRTEIEPIEEPLCVAVNIIPFASTEYDDTSVYTPDVPVPMKNNPMNDSSTTADTQKRIKRIRSVRESNTLPAIFQCPHCQDYLEICELRDCVFRHGYYRDTMQQIPSHSSREHCQSLVKNKAIYGCGKPFVIYILGNRYVIEATDYI